MELDAGDHRRSGLSLTQVNKAFTDFGIETLTGLIEIYKTDPDLLQRPIDPK